MQLLLPIVSTLAAVACVVDAQVPIPSKPLGFTYGNGSADAAVQLEVFFDLLCPDSKAAYPALQQLAGNLSSSQFRLRIHQFPLPYHHQAFSIAQASRTITHALGQDKFATWLETVYDVQDQYWNKQTENLGQKQVTAKIEALAKSTFPALTDAQWKDGMTGHGGTERDSETRTEWKHACTRGISGTPQYLLNDVPINAESTWTYDDWVAFLKPLLHPQVDNAVSLSSNTPTDAQQRHEVSTASTGGNELEAPIANNWAVAGYIGAGAVLGVGAVLAVQRFDKGYQRFPFKASDKTNCTAQFTMSL
ncbi:hypothetical protein DYB38_003133 [Aphanomyces astaci]|uniref:Thioredoxin-like fold domain-containing protein n=1 Tax=Aphanomyces astaci TaxID=112090 RepID=A0A397CYN6_APHAT|nr:hypothetical protein DYB38_003133 [Aphanomyces astaci]